MAQFKTRARALDLLGRQQIAGIPTAINELIKNAHDAYADRFDIDFFRKENLLVLRDDGLGMTKDEFENRWLTIGTESKFINSKSALPPKDLSKSERPIMGEKGIGRLAIASIGKQVLIISKAKKREESNRIIVVFINWEIFALPNINLEDIYIPIKEFEELPTQIEIDLIKKELAISLELLLKKEIITLESYLSIKSTIDSFEVNPYELNQNQVASFSLTGDNGGTFFYISPVDETLKIDIDGDRDSKEASKIEKFLFGFHNTMTPNHPIPIIDISFRDYKSGNDNYTNLIDKEQFFTPKEFKIADHHIEGIFDIYGQFSGNINIYGEKLYQNQIINWSNNYFKETDCGPFNINFAYIQGELKSSKVDAESYSILKAKGDKFGGLYIYKDNIRILPYGNSDYDFLDIEKNRTLKASTYYFSYRRMFGVIEIDTKSNNKLIEKAGREGFIENKAYRQMQEILKNFFRQIAYDYFNDKGETPKSEFWFGRKQELNSVHKALEKREKQAKVRKDKFILDLQNFFVKLASKQFDLDIGDILLSAKNDFNSIIYIKNIDSASQKILDTEFEYKQRISDYKKNIKISNPKGFTLSKNIRKDFDLYLNEIELIENGQIKNAVLIIDNLVEETIKSLNIEISKRKRLEQSVDLISTEARKVNSKKRSETNDLANEFSKRVRELTNDLLIDLDDQIKKVKDKFKTLSTNQEDFDLYKERKVLEDEIEQISNRNTFVMDRLIRQLENMNWDKDEQGNIITSDQISDALGEELEELRDRLQTDIELSQLGLAVGILHHEFSSTVRSIRSSLKDLKAWSDINNQLEGVYSNIKINFEHLDGYLNLFTPLNRRLNRKRENISLMELKIFLIDLFKSRMERHNIQFRHTGGYAKEKIYGFRSTFYPVFVNLIDNAIYWLNKSNIEEKIIRLHADETGIYISNNGLEIPIQDEERIFDLGFSRKVNGRGMGLSISREVLNAENYNISIVPSRELSTVTFKIEKNNSDEIL